MPASMLKFQQCLGEVLEEYKQLWMERSRVVQENASLRAELSFQINAGSLEVSPRPEHAQKRAGTFIWANLEEDGKEISEGMKEEANGTVPDDRGGPDYEDNWDNADSVASSSRGFHNRDTVVSSSRGNRHVSMAEEAEEWAPLDTTTEGSSRFGGSIVQTSHMEAIRRVFPSDTTAGRAVESTYSITTEGNKSSRYGSVDASSTPVHDWSRRLQRPFSHVSSSRTIMSTSLSSNKSIVRCHTAKSGSAELDGLDIMTHAAISLVTQGKTLTFCHLKLLEASEDGKIPMEAALDFLLNAIRDEDDPDFTISADRFDEEVASKVKQTDDGSFFMEDFYLLLEQAWRTDWTEKRLANYSPTFESSRAKKVRTSLTLHGQKRTSDGLNSPGAELLARERLLEKWSSSELLAQADRRTGTSESLAPEGIHLTVWGGRSSMAEENIRTTKQADFREEPSVLTGLSAPTMRSFASTGSLSSTQGHRRLFPQWWNPPRIQISAEPYKTSTVLDEVGQEKPSRFILSPLSHLRMCWDVISFFFVLYEVWASPFELVFLPNIDSVPESMKNISTVILVFFATDIILNFNTGYVRGYTVVLQRRRVVNYYLRHWFFVDFLATFPFDTITEQVNSSYLSSIRSVKLLKAMKLFRYIRLNQVVDTLKHRQEGFELWLGTEWMFRSCAAIIFLFMVTHLNCSIWAASQSDQPEVRQFSDAMDWYTDVFQLTFIVLLSWGDPQSLRHTGSLKLVEMLFVAERIVFCVVIAGWSMFKGMMVLEEDAQRTIRKNDTLRYLRRHNVPVKTQLQVVFALKQAARAKGTQNNFDSFLQNELPEELCRVIAEELWSVRLLTLGLIEAVAKWHVDFLPELALICKEEVVASEATVFRQGETCVGAYQVITGVIVIRNYAGDKIPSFKEGQWVGEKALVNPRFRRSANGVTQTMCFLMLVPAEGFQELLQRLELKSVFETWCESELWLGLCGRCGTIGDHFTDECPHEQFKRGRVEVRWRRASNGKMVKRKVASMWSVRSMNSIRVSSHSSRSAVRTKSSTDLQKFLHIHNLQHISKALEIFEVNSLEDLEECDKQELRAWMLENEPENVLTASDMGALTGKNITRFRDEVQNQLRRILDNQSNQNQRHLIFLSHYKLEAGTEAALMRSELEALIAENKEHPANGFNSPVFLDSEDLTDLNLLQAQVTNSHYVGLLCTEGVLRRPWCLVEIATAAEMGVPILPVQVDKRGNTFQFPDNNYYARLLDGTLLEKSDQEVLDKCNISLPKLESAIRTVFSRIAVPYSPHKAATIRRAELQTLLDQCVLEQDG